MGKFFEITVYNTVKKQSTTLKMEAGVTFENKNFSYTMENDGKVSIFDKNTKTTTKSNKLNLTDYQCKTLYAVANNNDDTKDGNLALSADDIQDSINQYNDAPTVLGEDLIEFMRGGNYVIKNPKAFESENKISAYLKNEKPEKSSIVAFKFEKEYFDAKIKNIKTKEIINIKMEKGVSFENNGAIYRMNNDGLLAVYDKNSGEWKAGINEIQMTPYQIDTFNAVANNTKEISNGKEIKKTVYSKADILKAMEFYNNKKLTDDLSEFLKLTKEYKVTNPKVYPSYTALSALVTNPKGTSRAELIFKYGSAQEALNISDFIHNNKAFKNDTNKNKTVVPATQRKKRTGKKFCAKNLTPSKKAIDLIKKREQYVPYTYDDLDKSNPKIFIEKGMKYKGTLTIGYGHTKEVQPGQTTNREEAEKFLKQDMAAAVKVVRETVKVPITQNQFDALVSFVFNIGDNAFKKSVLLEFINAGDFNRASAEFPEWKYSKGKVRLGLIDRRKEERALFDK